MPQRAVLLSNMRTGSSWLGDMLGNHVSIEYGKELLQSLKSAPAIEERIAASERPIFLWKAQGYQVQAHPECLPCIYQLDRDPKRRTDPRTWLIFLRRKNILDQYVSMVIANTTKIYTRQLGDSLTSLAPFHVDAEELLRFFRQEELWWSQGAAIASQCFKSIEVWYENLLRDLPIQMEILRGFLGVSEWLYESGMRRMQYRKTRHQVTNFAELRRTFAGTHYSWFFDD